MLIAYTQDFDAARERELGSESASERPPSLAMWVNMLRFVGDEGVTLGRISALSGIAKPTVKSMAGCRDLPQYPMPAAHRGELPTGE